MDAAESLYEQALGITRGLQDRESIAIGLLNLAMVSIDRGNGIHARPMLIEALTIADEVGSRRMGQSVFEVSAGLAALREEWNFAARFFGTAEEQAVETGLHRDTADEAFLAPRIAKTRASLTSEVFAAIEAEGRALGYDAAMVEARKWLENAL